MCLKVTSALFCKWICMFIPDAKVNSLGYYRISSVSGCDRKRDDWPTYCVNYYDTYANAIIDLLSLCISFVFQTKNLCSLLFVDPKLSRFTCFFLVFRLTLSCSSASFAFWFRSCGTLAWEGMTNHNTGSTDLAQNAAQRCLYTYENNNRFAILVVTHKQ